MQGKEESDAFREEAVTDTRSDLPSQRSSSKKSKHVSGQNVAIFVVSFCDDGGAAPPLRQGPVVSFCDISNGAPPLRQNLRHLRARSAPPLRRSPRHSRARNAPSLRKVWIFPGRPDTKNNQDKGTIRSMRPTSGLDFECHSAMGLAQCRDIRLRGRVCLWPFCFKDIQKFQCFHSDRSEK